MSRTEKADGASCASRDARRDDGGRRRTQRIWGDVSNLEVALDHATAPAVLAHAQRMRAYFPRAEAEEAAPSLLEKAFDGGSSSTDVLGVSYGGFSLTFQRRPRSAAALLADEIKTSIPLTR